MLATTLKVRLFGDPCLRKKSTRVTSIGPAERLLIKAMLATMHEYKGVGLAAPQVGINQRIFVADTGDGKGPVVVINPEILKRYGASYMEEGCLSIPGITVNIRRAQEVLVRYRDENNKEIENIFVDLMARVILHETDHLDGKLIIDHATLVQKRKLKNQLKKIQEEQLSGATASISNHSKVAA